MTTSRARLLLLFSIVITSYVQNLYNYAEYSKPMHITEYIAITNYVQYISIIKLLKNQTSSMSEKFLVISTNCFCVKFFHNSIVEGEKEFA